MSKFSGKCDVYDSIVMIGCGSDIDSVDEYLQRTKIYINRELQNIKTYKDLIPYFPRIVSMGSFSRDGENVIHITSKSYIDTREEESRKLYLSNDYEDCATEFERNVRLSEHPEREHYRFFDEFYRAYLAKELSDYGYTDEFISSWVYQGRNFNWRTFV